MEAQWRLESKVPALANAFRKASSNNRRRAVLVVCERVLPLVGLDGDQIVAGLNALREGRLGDELLQKRLSALSSRFDDEYLRLQEGDDDAKRPEALRLFSKARAASALSLAQSKDESQLHEAIYEALSAIVDDRSEVVRAVGAVLG